MKGVLTTLSEEPPTEDSEDLSDDEIEAAVETHGPDDLAKLVVEDIKQGRKFTVETHELRRRGEHLYYRCRMVCAQEPDRVLIYRVDWLGQ